MLVPPVVTDEAAGAAELLTVVLLLVVSAFEIGAVVNSPSASALADKCWKVLRREAFNTVIVFLFL